MCCWDCWYPHGAPLERKMLEGLGYKHHAPTEH